ncbi:MAG: hypothetical protein IT427_11735 [Pirellulales bacterium]|nr:hypothetical protein [Pirellulales bacterium]
MAKRSRSRKRADGMQAADHRLPAVLADEAQWTVDGPAYAEFCIRIDRKLETLVSHWIHFATPGSTNVRRVVRQKGHEQRRKDVAT